MCSLKLMRNICICCISDVFRRGGGPALMKCTVGNALKWSIIKIKPNHSIHKMCSDPIIPHTPNLMNMVNIMYITVLLYGMVQCSLLAHIQCTYIKVTTLRIDNTNETRVNILQISSSRTNKSYLR